MKPALRIFVFTLLALLECCVLAGQDVIKQVQSPYVEIKRGAAWGTSDLNPRVYIFTPTNPDQSMCIFIANNNPTSAHTFTLAVSQTGDPQVADFSHNQGRWIPDTVQGLPGTVAANAMVSGFVHSNAGAKIALQFSNNSSQAGSPDTADIFLVQTNATACGAVNGAIGQGYTLSTENGGTSAAPPIMAMSDGLGTAFNSTGSIASPTASELLLNVNTNAGTKSMYFDKVIVSSTVAAQVNVAMTNTSGSVCTAGSGVSSIKVPGVASSEAQNLTGPCTTNPTVAGGFIAVFVAANSTVIIDLKGYIASPGTANGIEAVNATAAAGTVSVVFFWYEK